MKDDKSDAVAYALAYQFLLGVFSLIAALALKKFVLPDFSATAPRYLLGGALWTASGIFSMQAFKRLSGGEATILGTASSLLSVVFGVVLLHEPSSLGLFLGSVVIALAVSLVVSEKLSFTSRSGILFSIAASFCSSLAVINDAVLLQSVNSYTYMPLMCFLPALMILVIFPKKVLAIPRNFSFLKNITLFSLFYVIHGITYYLSYQSGSKMSVLSALFGALPIIVVVLAAIFLKERKYLLRKFIAALLMAGGVFLLGI